MQSLSRGWSFLKQAWGIAFKDRDLLKPSVYALILGMIISVIGIIPIIIAAFIFGDSQIGQGIIFVLSAVMMFVQYTVSYVFSGMTAYLIYGYLTEGDGRMDKAWAIVRRDFFDILTLAAVSTLVGMARQAANSRRGRNSIFGSILRSATRAFEALWTEAAHLVLPAMIIDDLNLKDGLAKILKITRENLLLVGISVIGVRWVTGLIGFVVTMTAVVIAVAIAFVAISAGSTAVLVIGIGVAALIFFTAVMLVSVFSSYTNTAYNTCLYMWARNVEKAVAEGRPAQVAAPAPLAAVLGNANAV